MAVVILFPSDVTAPTMPRVIITNNRAYSAAEAPSSSRTKRRIAFNMAFTFLLLMAKRLKRSTKSLRYPTASARKRHSIGNFPHLLHPVVAFGQSSTHCATMLQCSGQRLALSNDLLIRTISTSGFFDCGMPAASGKLVSQPGCGGRAAPGLAPSAAPLPVPVRTGTDTTHRLGNGCQCPSSADDDRMLLRRGMEKAGKRFEEASSIA